MPLCELSPLLQFALPSPPGWRRSCVSLLSAYRGGSPKPCPSRRAKDGAGSPRDAPGGSEEPPAQRTGWLLVQSPLSIPGSGTGDPPLTVSPGWAGHWAWPRLLCKSQRGDWRRRGRAPRPGYKSGRNNAPAVPARGLPPGWGSPLIPGAAPLLRAALGGAPVFLSAAPFPCRDGV